MAHQVAPQQRHLARHHQRETRRRAASGHRQPHPDPEPVPEEHHVRQRCREDRHHLERLRELEPEEGHAHQRRVAEEPRQRPRPPPEDREEGPKEMEEAREVEGVGPEENPAGGASPEGKTEEPLEWRGLRAAPEPSRVADLGEGGEEDAGEDRGGGEGHGEGVEGGEGPEGDGSAAAGEVEDEVEE